MFILIGISLALVALAIIVMVSMYRAMKNAPTYDEEKIIVYREITWMEVDSEGNLIEKELIF